MHDIIRRRIAELERERAMMTGFPSRLRDGSVRVSSMPEDDDDQDALASFYEELERKRDAHIARLKRLHI